MLAYWALAFARCTAFASTADTLLKLLATLSFKKRFRLVFVFKKLKCQPNGSTSASRCDLEQYKSKLKTENIKIVNRNHRVEPLGNSRCAIGMPLRLRLFRVSDGARDNREALLKFSVLTLGEATG